MMKAATSSSTFSRWISGGLFLSGALCLALFEYFFPNSMLRFSIPGRVAYRALMALLGVVGLTQIASAISATRGVVAAPGIGKHRMVVPVEGIVYLVIMFALFTGAMLTKSNMLLLVFALMAGPFVINGWMTYGMLRSAQVTRTSPRRAMVGELFSVELELANTRRFLSIWVMSIRDTIMHANEDLVANVLFARVGPLKSETGHYQMRLIRRGRYRLGPILAISRFPLGLVERSRIFKSTDELLIYPRIGRLTSNWKRRWMSATELVARPQPHSGVFHDEFHRLREFRTGDNPRDIHWRTSARRGELILREYQQNRDFNLTVILDLWQPATRRGSESEHVERALSFVATMLVEHGRTCRDALLSLFASGNKPFRWQGQGTSASLESLFDGLALINAGAAADTRMLTDEALQRSSVSTRIILITTRPADSETTQSHEVHNPRIEFIRIGEIDLGKILVFDEPVTMSKPVASAGPALHSDTMAIPKT